jgi:hypothetical protein
MLPFAVFYPVDWIQYDNQAKAQLLIWEKGGAGTPLASFGVPLLPDGPGMFEIEISKIIFCFT